MPFDKIIEWLKNEENLGVINFNCAVLATVTPEGIPHSRIVTMREINPGNLIFFTQRNSRKVSELLANPQACLTFWLSLQQRQIILEGSATALSAQENLTYWQSLPRDRQLRFTTYAPTCAQPIQSHELPSRYQKLSAQFEGKDIPMSEFYCGFRFIPNTIYFYTLGTVSFSEVIKYTKNKEQWEQQLLSP